MTCVQPPVRSDPALSAADVQDTGQLREATKAIDIELNYHVIVGRR